MYLRILLTSIITSIFQGLRYSNLCSLIKIILICFLNTILNPRAMLTVSSRLAQLHLTQYNNHANISKLLDNLLQGYDNSVRPDFGGPPAIVEVDIMVRSMGPISEVDMTYSMDCYFRQSWVDKRLAFSGAQDTLALSVSMLARIWKPDTYFYNGKQSYLHIITTPNKFVRIYQNGRVLYSSRLTIKAGCPMNLEDFPMDIQKCPLKFGSFGYTTMDIIYRWNRERPAVAIAEDMKLSQFDLVDCPAGILTDVIFKSGLPTYKNNKLGNNDKDRYTHTINKYVNKGLTVMKDRQISRHLGNSALDYASKNGSTFTTHGTQTSEYSMLMVNFHLQRHMGNFLIQVYGPCCLLVVLSWVSFWLNREATADRVSLGITTILTMTFLGLEARTDLPKVPYPTALDFFVFLSFVFIFATVLQFAVVHYFTKYGSGECYFIIEDLVSDTESESDGENVSNSELRKNSRNSENYEVIPLSRCSKSIPKRKLSKLLPNYRKREKFRSLVNFLRVSFNWLRCNYNSQKISQICISDDDEEEIYLRKNKGNTPKRFAKPRRMSFYRREELQMRRKGKHIPQYNSVSKIDRASRLVFPMLFCIINALYWYTYLSRSSHSFSHNSANI